MPEDEGGEGEDEGPRVVVRTAGEYIKVDFSTSSREICHRHVNG